MTDKPAKPEPKDEKKPVDDKPVEKPGYFHGQGGAAGI